MVIESDEVGRVLRIGDFGVSLTAQQGEKTAGDVPCRFSPDLANCCEIRGPTPCLDFPSQPLPNPCEETLSFLYPKHYNRKA